MISSVATRSSKSFVQATETADATRARILREAATAFAERGFDGATFRDIGAAAGINFQSIRYHFGTKEALWEAVVERLSEEAERAIVELEHTLTALSGREQLEAQVRAIVTYQAAHPELQRILLREAMNGGERYRKAFDRYVKRFEKSASKFLGRLQDEGVVKAGIPIEDLFFIFRGALNYRLVAPSAGDTHRGSRAIRAEVIERHAAAVTRLLLAD